MAPPPLLLKAQDRLQACGSRYLDTYVKHTVKRPCGVCCGMMGLMMVISALVIATGNGDQTKQSDYDWNITDDPACVHMDMLSSARRQTLPTAGDAVKPRSTKTYPISLQFVSEESSDGGCEIFTPKTVQLMCTVEGIIGRHPEYLADMCVLSDAGTCSETTAVSASAIFYDGLYDPTHAEYAADGLCPLLDATDVASRAATLYDSLSTTAGTLENGFFVGNAAGDTKTSCRSRSLLFIGTPLDGYDQTSEYGDKQFFEIQEWLEDIEKELFKLTDIKGSFGYSAYREDTVVEGVEIMWYSYIIQNIEFERIIESDMLMAIGSILFVWFWMTVHTRSALVGATGILQIVLSLLVALFFYRMCFQILYFQTMQTLAIFVILGVGADDVFVLNDSYENLRKSSPDLPIETRLRESLVHTAQAVLNTSFTSTAAFLACGVSPIMPIATFGIYTAICIILNYAFAMTLTPAALVINEMYCCKKKESGAGSAANGGENVAVPAPLSAAVKHHEDDKHHDEDGAAPDAAASMIAKKYLDVMTSKPGNGKYYAYALLSVAVWAGWGLFMASRAALLVPPSEPEQWFPEDHMIQKFTDDRAKWLDAEEDAFAPLVVGFGMKGIDREDYNEYEPSKKRGDVIFDKNFELSDPEAQAAVLGACKVVRETVCKKKGCAFGLLTRPDSTLCFMEEFQTWHSTTYAGASTVGLSKTDFHDRLRTFRSSTVPSKGSQGTWEAIIGYVPDGDGSSRLAFVTIEATLTMEWQEPVAIKVPIHALVEKMIRNLDKPATARHVIQFANAWTWLATELGLIRGLFYGLIIAFPVAWVTLALATGNLLISAYAIATIGLIVSSVLGMAQWALGWGLGIPETVAGVIIIGLAVDYTIHIGHAYAEAGEKGYGERADRFIFSVSTMGATVLGGAITTAGSGCFLFACQLTFFIRMGYLIVLTIGFSLGYAMFFFSPLLLIAGPNGEDGSFGAVADWLRAKVEAARGGTDGGADGGRANGDDGPRGDTSPGIEVR